MFEENEKQTLDFDQFYLAFLVLCRKAIFLVIKLLYYLYIQYSFSFIFMLYRAQGFKRDKNVCKTFAETDINVKFINTF